MFGSLSKDEVKLCSTVSRLWYAARRRIMLRTISLHQPQAVTKLYHVLLKRPELCGLVRELDLSYIAWSAGTSEHIHASSFAPLVLMLKRVELISMPPMFTMSVRDCLMALSLSKTCTTLKLTSHQIDPRTGQVYNHPENGSRNHAPTNFQQLYEYCFGMAKLQSIKLVYFSGPIPQCYTPASVRSPVTELSLSELRNFNDVDLYTFGFTRHAATSPEAGELPSL